MIEKTQLNESDLLNSVVYFGAIAWCQPCKFLHPVMEDLSKKHHNLNFIYVDADNAPELVKSFGVSSVPTIKIFINKQEKKSFVGIQSKSTLNKYFNDYSGVES